MLLNIIYKLILIIDKKEKIIKHNKCIYNIIYLILSTPLKEMENEYMIKYIREDLIKLKINLMKTKDHEYLETITYIYKINDLTIYKFIDDIKKDKLVF